MYDFFGSDNHFSHENILVYTERPYADPLEMNEAMIARWNAQVAPGSRVLLLGDFAMGRIAESLPLVGRLNGEIELLAGNHDRCADMHGEKALAWREKYLEAGFVAVHQGNIRVEVVDGLELPMSHFPYHGDSHEEDRYTELRPRDEGEWLVHGHVHDRWRVNGRQINVGLDAWGGRLVTPQEILEIIEQGEIQLEKLEWV